MASSNRHWPSMFKSKPCNTHHHHHHHQWQHDINSSLISTGCHRTPYTSGCEERSPDPKPRWNPKPEQIRILEAIFNSGMVNPPRDEIRKIRAQLQEYGQVGDANVFYWFQNRKSRSKHKQRHLQNSSKSSQTSPITTATITITAPSSSSSSSEKSSPNSADKAFSSVPSNSPIQPYFQTHGETFLPEPFFFPVQQPPGGSSAAVFTQGFCFPHELSNSTVVHVPHDQTVGNCSGFLLSDLMMNHGPLTKRVEDNDDHDQKMKLQQQLSYTVSTAPTTTQAIVPPTTVTVPSTINHIQGAGAGVGETGAVGPDNPARSTVFINDVAFEVAVGPFSVREAFGDDAVLIHSTGQPVITNEWGVTLQSLQHGAFYYLVRMLTTTPPSSSSHDNPP